MEEKSSQTVINTEFNVYTDATGPDPDNTSPTLREYHRILWSKHLPNGQYFELKKKGTHLQHSSELGEFRLSSDSIAHSYKTDKSKLWLTTQIPKEVSDLFKQASTIGGYILFPQNMINGEQTINQARGCNVKIDDRFDLTLECIRKFYLGQESPLYDTLLRYKDFFDLFGSFSGYIDFFLLQDLVDENGKVKFYLPFDNFKSAPTFSGVDEYLLYKKGVMSFIKSRNKRINEYAKSITIG